IDIDETARALHIDKVDRVWCDDGDVNLEDFFVAGNLKVVQDEIARWQVIPQVRDGMALGLVHWFADGDHCGHQFVAPFSMASSTRARALWSASSASSRLLTAVRTCSASSRRSSGESTGKTTDAIPASSK